MSEQQFSIPQAASYVNRSQDTIRRWIRDGHLPARRSGPYSNSHMLVRREDLDHLLHPIPTVDPPEVAANASDLGVTLARVEARLKALESALIGEAA